MKTKTKLTLSLWLLFLLILVMGLAGTYYIYTLGKGSKAILKDNYTSIEFAKGMMHRFDEMTGTDSVKAKTASIQFDKQLQMEENNITEIGEKETVEQLRSDFERYRKDPSSQVLASSIRSNIYKISELNMLALERKNIAAQKTADNAVMYVSLLLAVCILICFSVIFNIPENMK